MKIENTRDYSRFTTIKGNRSLVKAHINKIMRAIETDTETIKFNPILVNDKMQIIDGQHRFEAIKKLQLPVYYIVAGNRNLEDVQKLNSGRKAWTPMDYAKSFVAHGNDNYAKYIHLRETYNINHDVLLVYLSTHDDINTSVMFKDGKLKVSDIGYSDNLCQYLSRFKPLYRNWHKRPFALAIKNLYDDPKIDNDLLVERVEKYGDGMLVPELKLVDCHLPRDYEIRLIDIYNYNRYRKNRVEYTLTA